MLPSNNTGINFQFCRLQNYGKKHAEKVESINQRVEMALI